MRCGLAHGLRRSPFARTAPARHTGPGHVESWREHRTRRARPTRRQVQSRGRIRPRKAVVRRRAATRGRIRGCMRAATRARRGAFTQNGGKRYVGFTTRAAWSMAARCDRRSSNRWSSNDWIIPESSGPITLRWSAPLRRR
ncbi:Hypothetical protein A7982_01971 [Minicystis rosea]|nr:Hypothetical protein A7982_01971 [Minicystis rosea]